MDKSHFHYVESGSGEPLVLIHGGNGSKHQFDLFRPLLGEGIRAMAYDQRDTPETPYSGIEPYGMREHAADCAAFISSLGLKKAHVMGTSYGGAIAMTLAIHFPASVQSLILAATTPSFKLAEVSAVNIAAETDPIVIERLSLELEITPDAIRNDPKLVAEVKANARPGPPQAVARRMSAGRAHDCSTELRRIHGPTLVLHGKDDPVIKATTAAWMAEQIPGAELEIFPDSRQGLTVQHAQRTADRVRKFVLEHLIK